MRLSTASAAASVRARDLDRLLHREAPRMEEVEVRRRAAEEALRVGQARGLVLGGVARDGAGGFHGALDRLGARGRRCSRCRGAGRSRP